MFFRIFNEITHFFLRIIPYKQLQNKQLQNKQLQIKNNKLISNYEEDYTNNKLNQINKLRQRN